MDGQDSFWSLVTCQLHGSLLLQTPLERDWVSEQYLDPLPSLMCV